MLVAGVGVLACITARRGFLMDALGKQLVGFMFPNQSVRSKQGVQRYWLISWSQRTLFSDKNVSKLSSNRCHVTGRSRRDRNLLFGLVKGNNFTFIFPQVMFPELAACRRRTLGRHTQQHLSLEAMALRVVSSLMLFLQWQQNLSLKGLQFNCFYSFSRLQEKTKPEEAVLLGS